MPSRKKKDTGAVVPSLPLLPKELLDQLVTGPTTAVAVEAVMRQFKKAFIECALGAEMTHHLGYEPGDAKPEGAANYRNGSSGKTVLTDDGALPIEVPRDRHGAFEPQLIGKHERGFTGFDDKIISMHALGMTVREVQAHLAEM